MRIGEFIRKTLLAGPSYSSAICRSYRQKYWKNPTYQSFHNHIYFLKKLGLVEPTRKRKKKRSFLTIQPYQITEKGEKATLDEWTSPKKFL